MEDKILWIPHFESAPVLPPQDPQSGSSRLQYLLLVQMIICFYNAMLFLIISIIPESSSIFSSKYYVDSVEKSIVNHLCIQSTFYKISYGLYYFNICLYSNSPVSKVFSKATIMLISSLCTKILASLQLELDMISKARIRRRKR